MPREAVDVQVVASLTSQFKLLSCVTLIPLEMEAEEAIQELLSTWGDETLHVKSGPPVCVELLRFPCHGSS